MAGRPGDLVPRLWRCQPAGAKHSDRQWTCSGVHSRERAAVRWVRDDAATCLVKRATPDSFAALHKGVARRRRGARVVSMSVDEIRDLTAVRGGIEALAIRLRGENYSDEEVAELGRHLDLCEEAIDARDVATYRHNDTDIHRLIVVGSRNPVLVAVYEQLHRRAQILELYFSDNWDSYRESLAEHREIVGLLAGAPVGEVEAAVWAHWQRSRARIATRFIRLAESDGGLAAAETDAAVATATR